MYSIYLVDEETQDFILLDTPDVDLETVFAVSDLADISNRKDTITKEITIPGTDNNNKAFGNLFYLNKHSSISLSNKIGFNYSPLRKVSALVYEDSILILKGDMFVKKVNIDKQKTVNYTAQISGKFVGLKAALGDSLLTDLNFTDLQHEYDPQYITDSWNGYISGGANSVGQSTLRKYNPTTNSYYFEPAEYGKGYCYPTIDYGEIFLNFDANTNYDKLKITNYRPAIWVKEYFKRIFAKVGYTFSIADTEFEKTFNRLLIPNADERLVTISKANRAIYTKTTTQPWLFNRVSSKSEHILSNPIQFDSLNNTYLTNFGGPYGENRPNPDDRLRLLMVCAKSFKSDARVKVSGSFQNLFSQPDTFSIQFVKRAFSTDEESIDFDVIAEQKFTAPANQTINFEADIIVPPYDFNISNQLQVRLLQNFIDSSPWYSKGTIYSASLEISKDSNTSYAVNASYNDIITPKPPDDIKQFDFIKSVISMFNLYVYNRNDNPTHLYLCTYDNFYAKTNVDVIRNKAFNWTNKVDFKGGFKINSNLSIPKKYTFTLKEDADSLNKNYKDKFGEIYGTKKFSDSLGLTESKSVEVIFSPAISAQIAGINRLQPYITDGGITLATKKPIKSNIKILYFNGVKPTAFHWISQDFLNTNGSWGVQTLMSNGWYAHVSNYIFDDYNTNKFTPYDGTTGKPNPNIPLRDIYFNSPKEFYFNVTNSYLTIPTGYNYYENQTKELTNPNLFTIELSLYLNEIDINTIDLSIPIYLDLAEFGHSYFKIVSINYTNNKSPSSIILQKIVL